MNTVLSAQADQVCGAPTASVTRPGPTAATATGTASWTPSWSPTSATGPWTKGCTRSLPPTR